MTRTARSTAAPRSGSPPAAQASREALSAATTAAAAIRASTRVAPTRDERFGDGVLGRDAVAGERAAKARRLRDDPQSLADLVRGRPGNGPPRIRDPGRRRLQGAELAGWRGDRLGDQRVIRIRDEHGVFRRRNDGRTSSGSRRPGPRSGPRWRCRTRAPRRVRGQPRSGRRGFARFWSLDNVSH